MRVDDVHDHGDVGPVRRVDQLFQLFRRAEPGRTGEKVRDVIAERSVIGMLHDGHELNRVVAGLDDAGQHFILEVDVPVMTVCPCSKAISNEGAHSQRATVRMRLRMKTFSWLEDFIDIAEASGSSAVYTLLKREDEKYVTEHAFAHPAFVEDVVRNVAQRLSEHGQVEWFSVEVESMESIHNHNAFARIERHMCDRS